MRLTSTRRKSLHVRLASQNRGSRSRYDLPLSPSAPRRGEVNGANYGLLRNVVGNTRPLRRLGDDGAVMAKNVMLKDPSIDKVLRQTNTIPVHLPPPDTKRWVPRRKAMIVNAVRDGVMSLEEACRCYELSVEELVTWQRAIETHGIRGLRVTRLQIYRDASPTQPTQRRHRAPNTWAVTGGS
jgi:hypothetical protein